ncbi:hypothetical protein EHE19_006410 [Ruminiclostridium herbifermentans]|uniref:Uncharacterized protein n=1 Tax=Ruminiclostridium herbifermentans TaxID=2488810 RepID=A0A4U7JAT6_9FIRM|nr:hypothetical protein [Ruminiclostridium herbifermentans]QNU68070.1 hypothetical protein EHE19_006410 [Ruminiclostridium herbifermentans]
MKFERKHRNIIIIAIAAFFILYGLLDMAFHFNIDKELVDKVSWILTIIAVALLFSGTKPKINNFDEDNNKLENDEDKQSNDINTENSIEADSKAESENSDMLIDGTVEQDNSNGADNKEN